MCKDGVEVLSVPAELTEWAAFPLSEEQQGRAIVVGRQTNGAKVYAGTDFSRNGFITNNHCSQVAVSNAIFCN